MFEKISQIVLNLAIGLSVIWFIVSIGFFVRLLIVASPVIAIEGLRMTLLSFFALALFITLSSIRRRLFALDRSVD